ncbi:MULTISPECIES: YqeB family protein [Thermomonosporaceae]|uniref:YqeB family protein n=1 Tax=Thermomonosporaceae TaxID=2012 RepID=UPI00255B0488|nr:MULTISPECIES: hypothetical protein [Thermomonosporaceae]MDL4770673.1 hypothetical protein [Actinomadura xylanilytica]
MDERESVLGYPRGDLVVIMAGFPVLGLVLGTLLPWLARWVTRLPVLPMRGPLEFVGDLRAPWQVAICAAAGLALGAGLAFMAMADGMRLKVTGARIEARRDGRSEVIDGDTVAAVFLDGKRLVVLDAGSRQVLRGEAQASASALAEAFRAHGYPWLDADPYAGLFHAWTPHTPELPAEVNAVLESRRAALKAGEDGEVRVLDEAVEKLGFTVRDEKDRQYWRPLLPNTDLNVRFE